MRISDWSSDVCSSDLHARSVPYCEGQAVRRPFAQDVRNAALLGPGNRVELGEKKYARLLPSRNRPACRLTKTWTRCGQRRARKSVVSGTSVSVRVDIGGRRNIKKKKTYQQEHI